MQHLFVYGTLMAATGNPAHSIVRRSAEYLCMGTVAGTLYDLGSYPGMVEGKGNVRGEVYVIRDQDKLMSELDRYEGFGQDYSQPWEFVRKEVDVLLENGKTLRAWTYFYNLPVADMALIEGGDYLRK